MTYNRGFILFALVLILGCSDFVNKSKNRDVPTPDPKTLEHNPFPAGYNPNEGEFSEAKMLANIGLNVIAPKVSAFRLKAELMSLQVQSYCAAQESGGDVEGEKFKARDLWKQTMLTYHQVAAVPVGPLTDGGGELSHQIYAWPDMDLCGTDQQVASLALNGQVDPAIFYSQKGLAAIEYLLFEPSLTPICDLASPNAKSVADWNTKPAAQKELDRCHLATWMTADLVVSAKKLEQVWDPAGMNFSKVMIDGGRYPEMKGAVNAMSDALFMLELSKDWRLGRPIGLNKDCISATGKCGETAEHRWSGLALDALQARLVGFYEAFLGAKSATAVGFGFDDYLVKVGRQDVRDQLVTGVDSVLKGVEGVRGQGTLQAQIEALNPTLCKSTTSEVRMVELCAVYGDLKTFLVNMKTDFLSVLALRAPPLGAGDSD